MATIILAIDVLLRIIVWALVIRAVMSWIPGLTRENPLVMIIDRVTEPILAPIRALVEKSPIGENSMIDFSPLVAFLIIELIRRFLSGLL